MSTSKQVRHEIRALKESGVNGWQRLTKSERVAIGVAALILVLLSHVVF